MFGYVVVNKPELRIKEFYRYRSYYCGLCKSLQKKSGIRGQLSLSYDMTFLAMLLSCLYEPVEEEMQIRCIIHPIKKQYIKKNKVIDYVADMTLLLTWYKCKDDFLDEKKIGRALYGKSIKGKVIQIANRYERQDAIIQKYIKKLSALEREGSQEIDEVSGCFGHLLEEVFVIKQDEWEKNLRQIGFYIGKFVYILDAYDDLEKDKKKGCFNPFLDREGTESFDDWVKQLLMMVAAEFAREFEKLPIVENIEILRNIIYSGMFSRYEIIRRNRMKDMEEQHEEPV